MTGARQRKQRREDLRTTLLDAGRQILLEEGLSTASSNLTFKRVFERVEERSGVHLTNASVIKRVWENQADFQADVLVAIAQDEGRPEAEVTVQAVASLFGELDLTSVASRDRALSEVCRVGGGVNSGALASSENWSLWISVVAMATAATVPEQRQKIRAALLEGYAAVNKFWEEIYAGLVALLGYRLRRPWTIEQFTLAATALSEGCSIRQRLAGQAELITRPTGPDGGDQEWTLFASGLEALARQFFEPDPDFQPPAPGSPP